MRGMLPFQTALLPLQLKYSKYQYVMADVFSPAKRAQVMAQIKSRNTKPERMVRSLLHRMGYRFRLHRSDLPGKPDIVLPRYQAVVFVHGCFWHRHQDCKYAYTPKSRTEFWINKLELNRLRDQKNAEALRAQGWRVFVLWECELKSIEQVVQKLDSFLKRRSQD